MVNNTEVISLQASVSSNTWIMISMVPKWLFLVIVLCVVQLECEIYQDRPKIKTENGDLVLEPALDKNIYLRPNGPKSSIYIGGIDILKTNTPKDAIPYQPSSNDNFDVYLNGPNGILKRLEKLESKETSGSDLTLFNFTTLSRKVNNLNRKVTALQNLINSRPTDECNSHPCQHGGTCLNLVDGYHCLCPSNWEGRDCDVDVNECRNFAGTDLGCQNGATCINRPGTYECLCKSGWFGLHCTRKAKDCSGGDFEMCGYGTCIPVTTGEGIKCICHQGWTSNTTSTSCLTDINECESSQGPRCSVNPKVECINLPGSFRCGQCPVGYEGDGYICNDIDECTTIPNGGCSPVVTCHNTIGSRICGSCPPGYQGDGITCTFVGSCSVNNGRCHPSAQCVETISSTGQAVQCICPEGMNGDGVGLMGCYVSSNNYTNSCEDNPCGSHGRCHRLYAGYTCICNKGYSGAHCDTSANVCVPNPCQNGGFCRQDETSITGFRCECTTQYSGALCQVRSKNCGGILDAEEGNIAFPLSNTTSTYSNNAQCAWVIRTSPDKVINVTFSKFNIEMTPECSGDFLQIHDGRKSSSQLIGRFCGTTFPNGGNIISSHNNLYFWFHSDRSVTKDGFALHWTSIKPVCGGEIDATTHGHISSPGSPGNYPPNRDCYWHLSTTPGKRISLHFFALDIETHANCSFDYLAIYDGEHLTDPLLSMYCNSTQPAPVQSASSDIMIHFHSDSYGSGHGFQIAYAPIEGIPGCGGYYTGERGEIVSPTYNGMYLPNLLCEYRIKTSKETKIKIEFKSFKLQRSFRCVFDYLKVYDGPSTDSQLVGKFCGTAYPASYISSSNELFFKFRTDRRRGDDGFRITYEAICVKTLIGDSGIITSPSYPFSYPANKVCEYIIQTEPGKAIQLTFQDFDVENSVYGNCNYDFVEIRDGPDMNSTVLGKYCGGSDHIPPALTSTHNYMHIRFKSDMSFSGTGFYANYTTIDTECGGIYKDTTGLINHPSGDATTYKNGQSCQWVLIAPVGMHIKLTWNRFEIENIPSCAGDYLELIEIADNNEEVSLGKFCGTHAPPTLTTSDNRLKIKFESDYSMRYAGFSLSYTFLDERTHCGGNYIKSHGVINSPGWPGRYDPDRDCTWMIRVPVGQQISLNITNFSLEMPIQNKCNLGDYLEIRNGGSETSPLIGQFCGSFESKLITSFANTLHLRFHSDRYISGSGFHIEWDGTVKGCGGKLTSSSGSISSPNYPNTYDDNAECFYKIVTNAGSRIRITFTELDLEQTHRCRDDYIEIYDGRDANSASLGKYCFMTDKSTVIETTSNFAFIKFRSDMYVGSKGFLLNYNTICNNNLTGRHGVIESPDFPNGYPLNLNCLWNIKVPKGNKINITFTHFDVYQYRRIRHFYRFPSSIRHPSSFSAIPAYSSHSYFSPYEDSRLNDGDCSISYLQMKETSEINYPKKWCGFNLPSPISTKSNSFQIQFSSGSYGTRSGFRLEWIQNGCGGHLQKDSGMVFLDRTSTNEREMECEWLIEVGQGKSVKIMFNDVYISKNCSEDFVKVYNGKTANDPLLYTICEGHGSMITDSNFMLVRFVKNSALRDTYFSAQFYAVKSDCGGLINAKSGFFYSKNYPQNYNNNLDCIWYISVPDNHRIEVNLIDFDLYSESSPRFASNSENDCGDSVLIYDNNDYAISNYTYRICPNSNQTQFVTKYSNVVVQFKTDSEGTAKGFKANFTVTCGAIITATHDGIITNEKFINREHNNCIWTIVAPNLDQKISLTLTHISLPKDANVVTNRNCPSAFLRVLDGDDKDAPIIGEYCGRKVPPLIVSRGNVLTIELGSYTNNLTGTFSAHYSSVSNTCGGTLTAEEGTIASPAYPNPYPRGADCEWTIKTSPGNKAYVTFERFDMEYSDRCNEDYLEIREGDGAGQILGVYCGNDIPTNYTSASIIYVKFHSNHETSGQGFLLHYGYLHENEIHGDEGEISSPLDPIKYEGAGKFGWRISTSGLDNIVFTIDYLTIPAYGDMSYNKLIIYDGYDTNAPILVQLDGVLDEHQTIQPLSSVVYIVLQMDESNTGSAFHMRWTKSSLNEVSRPEDRINCGFNETQIILPGNGSVLTSPNYPNDYGNNLNCEWVYETNQGSHLSLDFTAFHLEETHECFADSVSVYSADLPGDWKPVKEKICESTVANVETNTSRFMKIKLKTDSSVTKSGFRALVNSKCGGIMTDSSGEIGPIWSEIYSSFSRRKINCNWKIKVRPGRTIQMRFSHFNITNKDNSCGTFVVLRNGDSIESPLLESGRYCGYDHEKRTDIVTSSNSLYVSYTHETYSYPFVFHTFKIYYEEKNVECGATSRLTNDHTWEEISSPGYPNPSIPYTECVWVFSAPPGEIIRIDFIGRFDLDYTDNCGTEVVEIRDGSSNLSPLKGQYCGETPGTIKTTSNTVYIKYFTQLSEPRNGFKANISIDVCGGTILADAGRITSPGYPKLLVLPPGTVCEWRIIGTPRHVIMIDPVEIDLPQSKSHCGSKVDIEELLPFNNTVAILKTYCNDDINTNRLPVIQTSGNNVTIKLTFGTLDEWDHVSEHRGFAFNFNSSRPNCGGLLKMSEGYLATPGYPQETTIRYCQWLIEAPDRSRRIKLELIDKDVEKHRISIYNDLSFRSMITALPNNESTSDDTIFSSVGNKLSIYVFLLRSARTHRFKAKFSSDEQALCGGVLTALSQDLLSPDIQQSYSCEWHYNNQISLLEAGYETNVTFNTILITAHVNSSIKRTRCRYFDPRITIKSPINNNGLRFSREICGTTDVSYTIPSSILDITAMKTKSNEFNFNLNLKSHPCGGTISIGEDPVNILNNVPDSYNDTIDCAWLLIIDNNKAEINIEGTFELACDDQNIKIMQGLGQYSPAIGDYCRDKPMSNPLVTHYSYMYVQYHSKVKSKTNIKLIAKAATNQCGGILRSYQNVFTSPNYPKSYTANQECLWEIQADLGYRISLSFIDRFVVEDQVNCTKDVIIIYDWKDDDYIEMARVCGRKAPPPYNSTYNRMKVIFRTDADSHHDGFKASWELICGGKFKAIDTEQILYSPGYPYRYQPDLNCNYEISTTQSKQKVFLKFIEFDLEGSQPECSYDNLTITGQSNYDYLYRVFCGNDVPAPIRSYEKITIDFKSDGYRQKKGFKIAYSTFKCGGKVNDTTIITSNFGEETYGEDTNCTWIIEAPKDKVVVVKFSYIDLESHFECYNDYVALYDGLNVNSEKRLALLCGYDNSSTIVRSSGNSMVLEFVTDSSLNFRGFKAGIYFSYSEAVGCGGQINLTSGSSHTLKSPQINNSPVYENFLDCHWAISSPPDTVIKITFTNFHIAPCQSINQTAIGYSKCDCDLVEVKDGYNPNSLVIGTYCGHTLPPQLTSSGNIMSVRLSTDGELVSSGFEAVLSVHPSLCGTTNIIVSEQPFRFKSPGYDSGSIPRALHCVYHLNTESNPYAEVRVTVINLQLRPSVTEGSVSNLCNKDKLVISSSISQSNITSGKDLILNHQSDDFFSHLYFYDSDIHFPTNFELCGHKETVDMYLFGSISINLMTSPDDDDEKHKGVEIEIAYVGFCGRNYTEPHGRIRSKYYYGTASESNESYKNCSTLITAPENHTISLYFLNIAQDYWDDETYLEIYDGNTTKARLLIKISDFYENNYPVYSTGRYILLNNHKKEDGQLGFDLNYVTTNKSVGCGGKLSNVVGAVTSPFFPNAYKHKSICEWELETPKGTNLLLRFNEFELGVNCDQNYLELVDSKGVVVRTFCTETPADFSSTDNYIKLVFHTTMTNSGRGWSATFISTKS